ncbi:hypothetical protein PV326_013648 [Microctonus aethiopoides]|nr:hypothetical protein PV326_013648 [Microctonus aethiopoides]
MLGRVINPLSAFGCLCNSSILTAMTKQSGIIFTQFRNHNKHWNPKFKKLRAQKLIKIKLPDYTKSNDDLTPEEVRSKMKEQGLKPSRPWIEKQIFISATGDIFEAYVPPEGDGKFSAISKTGAKQKVEFMTKKGKSYFAVRKIRSYEEEFSIGGFEEEAQSIYVKAHEAIATKDKTALRLLVTEKAYPEVTHNTMDKTIRWKFIESLELPKVVHARCTTLMTKDNVFAQITVRFHNQQTLAVYDRFGRLMHGSEIVRKDVLEYVVFEKHLANKYGIWRIHGKIIPPWMPPREYSARTFIEKSAEEPPEVSAGEAVPESTVNNDSVVAAEAISTKNDSQPNVNFGEWTSEYYIKNQEICNSILNNPELLNQIPSLNSSALHNLTHGQLVRFQGMIQDMYNPEYYFERYEVKNTQTDESFIRCGLYKDSAKCQADEDIILDSDKNKSAERQTCVVISIPGLNDWAKFNTTIKPEGNFNYNNLNSATKRNLDALSNENNDDEPMDTSEPAKKKERLSDKNNDDDNDKSNGENSSDSKKNLLSKEHLLNFPIPIDDGKSCIVKIYNDSISYKLNQVIDIIGFISLDPTLNCAGNTDDMTDDMEIQTHNPPVSLIPRLHAIAVKELSTIFKIQNPPEILSKIQAIRSDLHMVLSQLLFGDNLAADYLICHLISSIYTRKDYLCLGNFPINITNFPLEKCPTFTKDFYDILSRFVTKSHYFEVTLDNLNDLSLVPKKDYECNRLSSGMLQLSNNTHLVIDETKLTSGQVSASGRLNYETISDVIKFQKITYDFKYYTMEYETDYPVLILSQVKSFIPCVMQIPLKFDDETVNLYPQVYEAAIQYLKDENRMNNIRSYLELLRNGDFKLGDDITDIIQDDFVSLRQSDKSVNADSLHSLMVFARFMALSHGENSLTLECWKRTFAIENERVSRLSQNKK